MADNNLPPGFRFFPTDEELVVHFLHRRDGILPFRPNVIPDLDIFPYNPWDLEERMGFRAVVCLYGAISFFDSTTIAGTALSEGSKCYYYSRRMQNRVTDSGYWKAMGMDEPIMSSTSTKIVGMKKYYMFHIGVPPSGGDWTNWIMHEYRLPDPCSPSSRSSSRKRGNSKKDFSKWVICKVYERSDGDDIDGDDDETELSCLDEVFLSMEDLDEISLPH